MILDDGHQDRLLFWVRKVQDLDGKIRLCLLVKGKYCKAQILDGAQSSFACKNFSQDPEALRCSWFNAYESRLQGSSQPPSRTSVVTLNV